MNRMTRVLARSGTLTMGLLLLGGGDAPGQSTPKVLFACYVPRTGTTYRIKEPGLSQQCTASNHVQFSWIDGVPGYDHGFLNGRADDDHPQYLLADGSRPLAGNLSLGSFRITSLAAGTGAGDAVRFEQGVKVGDAAGGDLAGTYPNPSVARIQGNPVSTTVPTDGQVLKFVGTQWTPTTPPQGVTDHGQLTGLDRDDHPQYLLANGSRLLSGNLNAGGFRITGLGAAAGAGDAVRFEQAVKAGDLAGGDLTGTYPNPSLKPFGQPLRTGASLTSGQVFAFDGSAWAPATAGGDVSGPYTNLRVTRLVNAPVSVTAASPTTGQVLAFDGSAWTPTSPAGGVSDHGALTGLDDDDHPQYLLANGTRPVTGNFSVSGNVGIGTTTPSAALHIDNPALNWVSWSRPLIIGGDQNVAPAIQIGYGGTGTRWGIGHNFAGAGLNFFTATSDDGSGTSSVKMYIRSDGNVGIGTTTPSAALHINNPNVNWVGWSRPLIIGGDQNVAPALQIGYGGTGLRWGIGHNNAGSDLHFFTTTSDDASGAIDIRMSISGRGGAAGPAVSVRGDLRAIGGDVYARSKNFLIPHPSRPDARLVHAALEGPEIAVYYRGEGRLSEGRAFVQLPSYFEALTRQDGRTVQLTAKGTSPYVLSASDVRDGGFWIYGSLADGAFFWEVRAVRADIGPLVVEQCDGDRPCR